jgi:hypothetical protein
MYIKDEDKLIKTVIIARSGIYKYRSEELPNLGLSINDAVEKKDVYLIYRPALVLSRDSEKFKMLPLTNGHPDNLVDSKNFKELSIGYTGETVDVEWNKEQGEVVLKTKVALVDNKALENYFVGIDEVSPGYLADFEWNKSVTPKGDNYDIIMTRITNGNHLAMTPKARGGSVACIIDSEGGKMSVHKFISGLWRNVRKIVSGVKDDNKQFRNIVDEIAVKKDTMKDEEVKGKIEELKSMASDLPDSDNKNILDRYLEDFGIIKTKDSESSKLAAGKIADLYEKLDSESQEGTNMAEPIKDPQNTAPIPKDASPEEAFIEGLEQLFMKYHEAKSGGEGTGGESTDEDKLEKEQFPTESDKIKDEEEPKEEVDDRKGGKLRRRPYDSEEKTDDEETEEPKTPPKNIQKKVGDSMGNVTMDSYSPTKGGLNDFFNTKIKGGKK